MLRKEEAVAVVFQDRKTRHRRCLGAASIHLGKFLNHLYLNLREEKFLWVIKKMNAIAWNPDLPRGQKNSGCTHNQTWFVPCGVNSSGIPLLLRNERLDPRNWEGAVYTPEVIRSHVQEAVFSWWKARPLRALEKCGSIYREIRATFIKVGSGGNVCVPKTYNPGRCVPSRFTLF